MAQMSCAGRKEARNKPTECRYCSQWLANGSKARNERAPDFKRDLTGIPPRRASTGIPALLRKRGASRATGKSEIRIVSVRGGGNKMPAAPARLRPEFHASLSAPGLRRRYRMATVAVL